MFYCSYFKKIQHRSTSLLDDLVKVKYIRYIIQKIKENINNYDVN